MPKLQKLTLLKALRLPASVPFAVGAHLSSGNTPVVAPATPQIVNLGVNARLRNWTRYHLLARIPNCSTYETPKFTP